MPSSNLERTAHLPVSNSYLQELESESIHALREAAAVFRKPVILYSIGKDSSVLLHLALKAFYPARPPFTLLHVDTTWKFREMIAFRDRRMKELGLPLTVHVNHDGLARGIGPFSHGAAVAEGDHLAELPAGVDVQQRDRRARRMERLQQQVQQHRTVLADGIQHHRVAELGRDLAQDVDAFGFEPIEVGQSVIQVRGRRERGHTGYQ